MAQAITTARPHFPRREARGDGGARVMPADWQPAGWGVLGGPAGERPCGTAPAGERPRGATPRASGAGRGYRLGAGDGAWAGIADGGGQCSPGGWGDGQHRAAAVSAVTH